MHLTKCPLPISLSCKQNINTYKQQQTDTDRYNSRYVYQYLGYVHFSSLQTHLFREKGFQLALLVFRVGCKFTMQSDTFGDPVLYKGFSTSKIGESAECLPRSLHFMKALCTSQNHHKSPSIHRKLHSSAQQTIHRHNTQTRDSAASSRRSGGSSVGSSVESRGKC